jgi:predicted AAA+ superfamily ATPase
MSNFIFRDLTPTLKNAALHFPIVALLGPRQSGKSSLAKEIFPDYQYVSLEDPDIRLFAIQDPRGFLKQYSSGSIIDEIQRVPELFSYLQTIVDAHPDNGQYVLTGSQNFLLLEKITQSLAGRVAVLNLLPLSISELKKASLLPEDYETLIFQGGYPRIHARQAPPTDWYASYISTYLERDVRLIRQIGDLSSFQRFLQLCAGRCGQILNFSSLANETGMSVNTIKSWISILEASFVVYLMRPHFKNFNKRLTKSPKLYFYDTGLACALLQVSEASQIQGHYLQGGLFENLVVSELLKLRFNKGKLDNLYFFRDQAGREIDCIQENAGELIATEIKSSRTFSENFLNTLFYYKDLSDCKALRIIYGGDISMLRQGVSVFSWHTIPES